MRQNIAIFILLIAICNSAFSQDSLVDQNVKVNQQFWLDYNFTSFLNEKNNFSTQIGFRKITPNIYNRLLVISTFNIKNNNKLIDLKTETPLIKSYHLGFGLIYTQNYNKNDNFELRLIQGFKFDIPTIKLITLNNYIRLEERFQNTFDNSGWDTAFRLRYRISTNLSWNKRYLSFIKGLYIPLEAEFFFNLKKADRFNDVVRLSPGLGYKLENEWRFELYLIFNRSLNLTETNNKSSDFILRIRVYSGSSKKPSTTLDFDEI